MVALKSIGENNIWV